eukprot:5608879-Pleurochrysis_carterae.AAC.1
MPCRFSMQCPEKTTRFCLPLQSFGTVITQMMYYAVATVREMLILAQKILVSYSAREVKELRALWDFSAWLRPH